MTVKIIKWITMVLGFFAVVSILLIHQFGPIVGAQLGKPIYIIPPSATKYGNVALDMIEFNGYYAKGEKWSEMKEKLKNELEEVSTYEATYPIIEEALQRGGGKHSFLMTEEKQKMLFEQDKMPEVTREDELLIIKLPEHIDGATNGKRYVETVLQEIKKNDDIKGAIVDLRGNIGGDMGPMITAISPFLENGDLFYLEYSDNSSPIKLEDWKVIGGGTQVMTDILPFKLDIPVAVLMDDRTMSSGEAVLTALAGQQHTKTFGRPTGGYASANVGLPLYDDATIIVTVAYYKTLDGKVFHDNPIIPDVETDDPLGEAKNWITK